MIHFPQPPLPFGLTQPYQRSAGVDSQAAQALRALLVSKTFLPNPDMNSMFSNITGQRAATLLHSRQTVLSALEKHHKFYVETLDKGEALCFNDDTALVWSVDKKQIRVVPEPILSHNPEDLQAWIPFAGHGMVISPKTPLFSYANSAYAFAWWAFNTPHTLSRFLSPEAIALAKPLIQVLSCFTTLYPEVTRITIPHMTVCPINGRLTLVWRQTGAKTRSQTNVNTRLDYGFDPIRSHGLNAVLEWALREGIVSPYLFVDGYTPGTESLLSLDVPENSDHPLYPESSPLYPQWDSMHDRLDMTNCIARLTE